MSFSKLGLLTSTKHDIYPFIDPAHNLKGAAHGKIVLVSGAGTGIGRSIAEAFAQAGAKCIIIAARRLEPLEEAKASIFSLVGDTCQVIVKSNVDIQNLENAKSLFDSLEEIPDVLVNNAGASGETASVLDADPDKWCMDIDVNVKGTFFMCQAYLKSLERSKRTGVSARIINVSSIASYMYVFARSPYSASKVAMNNLSEYIDRECLEMDWNVRCFSIHPGGVMTDTAKRVAPDAILQYLTDKPELAGGSILYLSTPQADYLGGRYVDANWDLEALEGFRERIVKEDLLRTRVIGEEWRHT